MNIAHSAADQTGKVFVDGRTSAMDKSSHRHKAETLELDSPVKPENDGIFVLTFYALRSWRKTEKSPLNFRPVPL